MEMLLRTANGELPKGAKEYAGKKLDRISKFFHKITAIEVVYSEQKGQHHVEMLIDADGYHVRGSSTDPKILIAIDKSIDKIETQVKKFRKRIIKHHQSRGNRQVPEGFAEFNDMAPEATLDGEEGTIVVEQRRLNGKPMTAEEAAFQLDLIGRGFFMFRNSSNDAVSVIYRRQDGNLVLLEE